MHRSQKANSFSLNHVIFFLNLSYIFWEDLRLTCKLIKLTGKKCVGSKPRSEQENTILMIPDMFKVWYVSYIPYSEWGLSAPLDRFPFLPK